MFWSNCMAWKASEWIQTGGTQRVTWVYSTSCLKMSWDSASWKNNSASWMKMAWNSASCMNNSASRLKIALDSASLVEESQYFLVESRIGESRDDLVSCVLVDSELLNSASLGVTRRVRSRME